MRIKQTGTLTPPQQAICDETCGCIIGAMFEPSGKRKRDPSELGAVSAECIARLQACAAEPSSFSMSG